MDTIRKTSVIAMLTIEENIRKKILYILLFISVVLVGFSASMTSFNLGAQVEVMKDISLSGINLFGIVFTLALFLNVIPREIETKTIYPFVTQPITRATYLSGKFLGLFLLIAVNMLILAVELLFVLKAYTGAWNFVIFQVVLLNILQCGILGALMLALSLISSYPLALSATVFLYMLGGISAPYLNYLKIKLPESLVNIIIGIKLIIPKFDVFNLKDAIVHDATLNPFYFPVACLYGIVYILAINTVAIIFFEKKDM